MQARLETPAGDGKEYLRNGVILNPDQTFGIEIEFQGGSRETIRKELDELGLTATAEEADRHPAHRGEAGWRVKKDLSCSGGEVTSPIMSDSEQTWKDVATVCRVIKKHGGYVDQHNGGHIHVGIESTGFDDPLVGLKNVAALYMWAEDLLYRVTAAPETYPFHRGMVKGFQYCEPWTEEILQTVQRAREVKGLKDTGRRGLNFSNVAHERRDPTVEFRFPDGTLNAERIRSDVMICCALMHAASQLTSERIPGEHHPLGTFDEQGVGAGDAHFREFCDLVLQIPEQKLKFEAAYRANRWQVPGTEAQARIGQLRTEAHESELSRLVNVFQHRFETLSDEDVAWLHGAVNWQGEPPGEPPSQEAKAAYHLWMFLPLPEKLTDRDKWGRWRVEQVPADIQEAARNRIVASCVAGAEQDGRPLSDMETEWLVNALTAERVSFNLLAPTRYIESVYVTLMEEGEAADFAGAFDMRLVAGVRGRWRRYHDLSKYRAERDRVASSVESDIDRLLTNGEEEAISRLVRVDCAINVESLDIASTACLDSIAGHLRASKVLDADERVEILLGIRDKVHLGETLRTEVSGAAQTLAAQNQRDASHEEVQWLEEVLGKGSKSAPPSEAVELALFEWAAQPLSADVREHPEWAGALERLQIKVLHQRDLHGLLADAIAEECQSDTRPVSDAEYEWLTMAVRWGDVGAVPSLRAGRIANAVWSLRNPVDSNIVKSVWERNRARWLDLRDGLLRDFQAGALASLADLSAEDATWVKAMLTSGRGGLFELNPSQSTFALVEALRPDQLPGFDPEMASALHDTLEANRALWATRSVVLRSRDALRDALGAPPEAPVKVVSWTRRLTTPSVITATAVAAAAPPSPAALIESAKWMLHPLQGDAASAKAIEGARREAWATALSEIRAKNRVLHPRWRKAVERCDELMKQAGASERAASATGVSM